MKKILVVTILMMTFLLLATWNVGLAQTSTPTPDDMTPTPTLSPDTLEFAKGEPIRIGYLLWETHYLGIDSIRGIEIAIDDFGGELYGHLIELTRFDSGCNESAGQRGAQLLVEDDAVVGVLGTTCSQNALVASSIISDGNKVMVSPSNTSLELTDPESRSPGYFRTAPNDLHQIKGVAQYAYNDLGALKLATVFVEGDELRMVKSEALCQAFADLGGECVLELAMEGHSIEFAPVVDSLVEAAPDVIYFMGWGIEEGAAFLAEARTSADLESAAIFVWEIYMNPNFLEQAGEDAVGVYVSATSYDYDQEAESYQEFLDSHRANYDEEPVSNYHSYAYDAATLLLKAIAQVAVQGEDGSLMVDPLAVRDALYVLEGFQGLTGMIACSEYGDCASSAEGKVYEFTSGDPNTFNPGPAELLSSNPAQVWPYEENQDEQ